MGKKINLVITTPTGEFYKGEVEIITLKLAGGYMGVMANMSPVVSTVVTGTFEVKESAETIKKGMLFDGLFSTDGTLATVITDKAH